jgi:hypothetical protein
LRLRVSGRRVWRGRYRFAIPGSWSLSVKGATLHLNVRPYPESTFVPLGQPGCSPPSPANGITHEARGSGTLWALLDVGTLGDAHAAVLDGAVGKETKIVWRMGGSGDLELTAVAPDGSRIAPYSLEAHAGSTWERPGDEWGSGFTFSRAGCWQLHAIRDSETGDLWLLIRS